VSQARQQAARVAYRAFSDVAGKGAFFVITLLAARRLSQNAFGVFSLATTIGWMAAVAADFGIQLHLARAVAQRPEAASTLLASWLRIRLWTAGVAVVAVTGGLAVVAAPADLAAAIVLYTMVYVTSGLVELLHYFYRGLSRTDVESTIVIAQRSATLLLAVAVLIWWPGVIPLAFALLVPVVVTVIYSARLARRLAERTRARPAAPGDRPATFRLMDVLPIGAGIVLSALYFRIDVFLIDAWAGTEAVALYNAVFRLVEALRLFPAAVVAVALPVLFRATTRQPLLKTASLLATGAMVVTIAPWRAATWLIPLLYGARYAAAVPAFRILLLSFPLMSLNYALTHQLIGWHGHRTYAALCGVALAANVTINARLIPAIGITGAAWTAVWTEGVMTVGCALALARMAGFDKVVRPSPPSGPAVVR
jgi:O-antigen/teichoic acid export membrane protein